MGYNDIYRIAALIVKSIKGKESEEERNELDVWRNASDRNRRLYQKYQDAEYFRARSIVKEKNMKARKESGKVLRLALPKEETGIISKGRFLCCRFALLLSAGALWIIQSDVHQFEYQDDLTAIRQETPKLYYLWLMGANII